MNLCIGIIFWQIKQGLIYKVNGLLKMVFIDSWSVEFPEFETSLYEVQVGKKVKEEVVIDEMAAREAGLLKV